MRATLASILAVLVSLVAVDARADVVGACPPGFDPSHSGCLARPGALEVYLAAGVVAVIAGVVLGVVIARRRRKRRS